jgi:hypothetical protein
VPNIPGQKGASVVFGAAASDSADQHDNRGPAPAHWSHRGIDQARGDHQPFNWNGRQVRPEPAGNGHGWGFWFLNQWIPL